MEGLRQLFTTLPDKSTTITVSATVLTTLAVLWSGRVVFQTQPQRIIKNPAVTLLPKLSEQEIAELPYPPDSLPGGRFVETPYGTIRVYEWGPEEGRKVMMVHGITTPCLALGAIAHGLVDQGCRVMLMDLWGRGYSDCCADLEHDNRLYSTEILMAITSSPLSWIGGADGGFSLIGYSLGGGIAAAFASYFSSMVKSLVLFAPSGLIRAEHMSGSSRFLYSPGVLPKSVLESFMRKRLQKPISLKKAVVEKKTTVSDAATAEMRDPESVQQTAPLSKKYAGLNNFDAVQWQIRAHAGFVTSFISSIRFAPITGQNATWVALGKRPTKTLVFAGKTDPVIIYDELKADIMESAGAENIDWETINGAHDFPGTHSVEVVQTLSKYWNL